MELAPVLLGELNIEFFHSFEPYLCKLLFGRGPVGLLPRVWRQRSAGCWLGKADALAFQKNTSWQDKQLCFRVSGLGFK